ncbi:MAG: RNA polymerase sigma factor [Myxococcales bacterium]
MSPPGESELLDRLRSGDRAAFRELYARFSQPTFRFLARLTGRRDAAEDLHQETWLQVARNHDRLRPDSDLPAWLFTIARNAFLSSRRRSDRLTLVPECASLASATGVISWDSDPTCRDLERALADLPETHREILLLVAIEGLEIRQAATVLDLSADAARQRLSRARAALAVALYDAPGAEAPRSNVKGRCR